MRRIKNIGNLCLESFLSKEECNSLIKANNMKDLSTLCRRDSFPSKLFILKEKSLSDIYATEKDWSEFLSKYSNLSDPSSNALSHYLNSDNNRITTNSVFFTDSTSGITLLNPRFVFLVKKSNTALSKSFPEIHKSITVVSTPVTAAEIEDYYTEGTVTYIFKLKISYENSKGDLIDTEVKILPDKEEFLRNLKSSIGVKKSQPEINLNDEKRNALEDSIKFYNVRIEALNSLIKDLSQYLDTIDNLIIPRKVLNKSLIGKINEVIPEDLQSLVYTLLKEGSCKINNIKIDISPKSIVGRSLQEELQTKLDFFEERKSEYENQLGISDGKESKDSMSDDLIQYSEAISKRMSDIYDFVTKNPFNSNGKIPSSIITKYRNNNALLFVLCPTADAAHRCMYVSSVGDDVRSLKYSFNAAGTSSNSYEIKNGSLVVQ